MGNSTEYTWGHLASAITIADLKPGDKVLATSISTGKTQAEPVTAVLVHYDTDLYDLTVTTSHGTEVIHTTSSHLFWDPYLDRWIPANLLKAGEHLKTPDGKVAVVAGGSTPADPDGWMWDLTVPGNNDHDFYIDTVAGSVLVHNDSCPMIGEGGTQVTSRTLMQNQDFHIDVENPNP